MRLVIVNLVNCLTSFSAFGCMCSLADFSQEEYNLTKEIFIGKIVETVYDEAVERYLVKLEIYKSYKGILTDEVYLQTQNGKSTISSCNFNGKLGETFMIFLTKKTKFFEMDLCTRKVKLSRMNEFDIPEWFLPFSNIQEGFQENYYLDNVLKSEGWILEGQAQGEWRFYNEFGLLEKTGFYKNGRLDSIWTSYTPSGEIISIQNYSKGEFHGNQFYYPFYKKYFLARENNYQRNKLHGEQFGWFPSGELANYSIYELDSLILLEQYDYDGVLWEGNDIIVSYEYSEEYGKGDYISDSYGQLRSRVWWPNDTLRMISWKRTPVYQATKTGEILLDKGNGIYTSEYSKGEVKDSLKTGIWFEKNYQGIMEYKTYEKGILNGFYQRFSPDSLLIKEGNYSNGEKDGLWNLYYRSGILKEQLEYTQFNLVGSMRNSWNPEGQQMIKDGIGIEYFYNVDGELLAGMRIKHGKRRTKILKWKPPN